MEERIKLAAIDDDPYDCEIVKDILSGHKQKFAFYFKTTIPEFKDLVISINPDIVLIDVYLPFKNQGLEVIKWIKESHPSIKAIVYSGKSMEILEAILWGADSFISKLEIEKLPLAIKEVYDHGIYISPKNSKLLIEQVKEHEKKFRELLDIGLTSKEMLNLNTLLEEKNNVKAAQKLESNLHTFKSQNTRILKKFKKRRMRDVLNEFGKFLKNA